MGVCSGTVRTGEAAALQDTPKAGLLFSNICVKRPDASPRQASWGLGSAVADRGPRCSLAMEVCAVGCRVQPAAPAERGREVSRGWPVGSGAWGCSPKRNCKSSPSAFPPSRVMSCGDNIRMLVLIMGISGEGQGMICTELLPGPAAGPGTSSGQGTVRERGAGARGAPACPHQGGHTGLKFQRDVRSVQQPRTNPTAYSECIQCIRLMEKHRRRAKSKATGKVLHT